MVEDGAPPEDDVSEAGAVDEIEKAAAELMGADVVVEGEMEGYSVDGWTRPRRR